MKALARSASSSSASPDCGAPDLLPLPSRLGGMSPALAPSDGNAGDQAMQKVLALLSSIDTRLQALERGASKAPATMPS